MIEPYYKEIIESTTRMRDGFIADANTAYSTRMRRIVKRFFPVGSRVSFVSELSPRGAQRAVVVAHMPEKFIRQDVVSVKLDVGGLVRWVGVPNLTLLKKEFNSEAESGNVSTT